MRLSEGQRCGSVGPDRVRDLVHMSVPLQRHRGIARAMLRASAGTHDLLQSAVLPCAVVPSRQDALDGGIILTIFEGYTKLTGNLLMANLEGFPILRWLLYIQGPYAGFTRFGMMYRPSS